MPAVSVICPVFNTPPALLRAAVGAVLEGGAREVLLADDASTDAGTREALRALADDPRVVLCPAERNGGPARARNRALERASGDWVAFTDADDLWRPDHLPALEAALGAAPDAAWVATNHAILDARGGMTPEPALSGQLSGDALGPGLARLRAPALTRALAGNYWLHLGGCFVRAGLLRRLGGFAADCTYSEDWLLFLRLSTQAELIYADSPTYLLRRQGESLTTSPMRLTGRRLAGKRAALRDPLLRPYRRELRWALIATLKGLAANNLLAGHRGRAAWFAARVLAADPGGARDAARFASAFAAREPAETLARLRRYTRSELAAPSGA